MPWRNYNLHFSQAPQNSNQAAAVGADIAQLEEEIMQQVRFHSYGGNVAKMQWLVLSYP